MAEFCRYCDVTVFTKYNALIMGTLKATSHNCIFQASTETFWVNSVFNWSRHAWVEADGRDTLGEGLPEPGPEPGAEPVPSQVALAATLYGHENAFSARDVNDTLGAVCIVAYKGKIEGRKGYGTYPEKNTP